MQERRSRVEQDWELDQNGVSVTAEDGTHVVDLHSECILELASLEKTKMKLFFKKPNDNYSDLVKANTRIVLTIDGIESSDIPELEYPTVFEGIYDCTDSSMSVCIGSEACYPVRGSKLKISFSSS